MTTHAVSMEYVSGSEQDSVLDHYNSPRGSRVTNVTPHRPGHGHGDAGGSHRQGGTPQQRATAYPTGSSRAAVGASPSLRSWNKLEMPEIIKTPNCTSCEIFQDEFRRLEYMFKDWAVGVRARLMAEAKLQTNSAGDGDVSGLINEFGMDCSAFINESQLRSNIGGGPRSFAEYSGHNATPTPERSLESLIENVIQKNAPKHHLSRGLPEGAKRALDGLATGYDAIGQRFLSPSNQPHPAAGSQSSRFNIGGPHFPMPSQARSGSVGREQATSIYFNMDTKEEEPLALDLYSQGSVSSGGYDPGESISVAGQRVLNSIVQDASFGYPGASGSRKRHYAQTKFAKTNCDGHAHSALECKNFDDVFPTRREEIYDEYNALSPGEQEEYLRTHIEAQDNTKAGAASKQRTTYRYFFTAMEDPPDVRRHFVCRQFFASTLGINENSTLRKVLIAMAPKEPDVTFNQNSNDGTEGCLWLPTFCGSHSQSSLACKTFERDFPGAREQINAEFTTLPDQQLQENYIVEHVDVYNNSSVTALKQKTTFRYFFVVNSQKVYVCRSFFTSTLGIKQQSSLRKILDKMVAGGDDAEGRAGKAAGVSLAEAIHPTRGAEVENEGF